MKVNKLVTVYVLNILGLLILFSYFWFRFIRERLPRIIPFNLSFFSFLVIIVICTVFVILLKQVIKPTIQRSESAKQMLAFFNKYILSDLKKPLEALDTSFRNIGFIKNLLYKIVKAFRILFYSSSLFIRTCTYCFFVVFPKTIIVVVFLLDVFLFGKLYLFYKILPISLIYLFFIYSKYALEKMYVEYLAYLEHYYEVDILQTEIDPELESIHLLTPDGDFKFLITEFLWLQSISNYEEVIYKCCLRWNVVDKYFPEVEPTLRIWDDFSAYTPEQRAIMEKDFHLLLPVIRDFFNFRAYYNIFAQRISILYLTKIVNIIMYSSYLLGWFYILFISVHTLHLTAFDQSILSFVFSINDIYEPFSNTLLINTYDERN